MSSEQLYDRSDVDSLNTMALSYLPPSLDQCVPLEASDHRFDLRGDVINGFNDSSHATQLIQHHTVPHSHSQDSFASYNAHYSDVFSSYEHLIHQDLATSNIPSIDRDNKLLSLSQPTFHYTLLDQFHRQVIISLSAQLQGTFFLAESPWATTSNALSLTELTCYRRNFIQICGNITLPRSLRYIVTEQNEPIPIISQKLVVTAYESTEGAPVKIISVPWKTPGNVPSTVIVNDKVEKEPSPIVLDLMNGQNIDNDYVVFPINWKRLQFRIATANNGRRKELQQHFIIRLKVVATLVNGIRATLCESDSGAIIVRGRSPRNFESRKDFPISNGNTSSKKSNTVRSRSTRALSGDSGPPPQRRRLDHQGVEGEASNTETHKESEPSMQIATSDLEVSPNLMDWKLPSSPTGTLTTMSQPFLFSQPAAQIQSSPDKSNHTCRKENSQKSVPIRLSLLDDEPTRPVTSKDINRARKKDTNSNTVPLQVLNSPGDAADLLYEYFPLSMDDWMPPVDAVYRPHVVHHTNIPPEMKTLSDRSKSRRYFSEVSP